MITETKNPSGSPDPALQGEDGESAGTESILKDEKPCIRMHDITICISRKGYLCLHDGPCQPVDQDGNIIGLDREAINDIIREDRADRIRADKLDEESIIDADQMNLELRRGKTLQTFQHGKIMIREVAL